MRGVPTRVLSGRAKKGLSVDDEKQQKVRRREFVFGLSSPCQSVSRICWRRAVTRWRMIC